MVTLTQAWRIQEACNAADIDGDQAEALGWWADEFYYAELKGTPKPSATSIHEWAQDKGMWDGQLEVLAKLLDDLRQETVIVPDGLAEAFREAARRPATDEEVE